MKVQTFGIEATEDYTTFKIWAPSATYIKS